MPKIDKIKKPLTTEEIIQRASELKTEENVDKLRSIVCTFYGDKCCSKSANPDLSCSKDECVMECKKTYLEGIFTKPIEKWEPGWEKPIKREPKKQEIEVGLTCNNCYLADHCHEFQLNATCAIDWGESTVSTDPKDLLDTLIRLQYKRIVRAQKIEEVDGGVPDQNLSAEMDRLAELSRIKSDLSADKFSLSIKAESKSSGGGILQSLFAGVGGKELPSSSPTIDIPFTEELLKDPDEIKPKIKQ